MSDVSIMDFKNIVKFLGIENVFLTFVSRLNADFYEKLINVYRNLKLLV